MAYRDDLESALARVDALQVENARLAADNEELRGKLDSLERAPPRPGLAATAWRSARIGFSIIVTLATVAGVAFGVWGMWHGCMTDTDSSWTKRVVTGKLSVTGAGFGGTWDLVPGTCRSGQAMSFYGVDVIDATDPKKVLRLIEDPAQGTLVKLNVPGTELARFIARTDCKTWEVHLLPTNNYMNDIRLLDGNVALECTLSDGSTIAGRLDFKGCR